MRGRTLTASAAVSVVMLLVVASSAVGARADSAVGVRLVTIHYRAHGGVSRTAVVLLPAWYGATDDPPVPLVISPHGRGRTGMDNARLWGDLPAAGSFAVVSPDGMGRRLKLDSFGYRGQIDDLARMPALVTRALPWLQVDRSRIYAVGSSMGGQETLLLVARHPHLLAAAVAMDSVTDLARRYRDLADDPALRKLMRREVGGTPARDPGAYAARSPLRLAAAIAGSGVHLQVWWSRDDQIVRDQRRQSEALLEGLLRVNPCTPVSAYVGAWAHSAEMRAGTLLPVALAGIGLLPSTPVQLPSDVQVEAEPACAAANDAP